MYTAMVVGLWLSTKKSMKSLDSHKASYSASHEAATLFFSRSTRAREPDNRLSSSHDLRIS